MSEEDPYRDLGPRERAFWVWFDGLHWAARALFVLAVFCISCPWVWLLVFFIVYCGGVPMG